MTNAATKALAEIEALLTNLQPHIAQACIPGHAGFIDNYVDPALEIARAALSADPVAADGREPNWQSIETAPAFGKPPHASTPKARETPVVKDSLTGGSKAGESA